MTKKISIRIDDQLDSELRNMADERNVALSEIVVDLICVALDKKSSENIVEFDDIKIDRSQPANKIYGNETRYILRIVEENLNITREMFDRMKPPVGYESHQEFYDDLYKESHSVLSEFPIEEEKNKEKMQ